jgi:hypothetical protein
MSVGATWSVNSQINARSSAGSLVSRRLGLIVVVEVFGKTIIGGNVCYFGNEWPRSPRLVTRYTYCSYTAGTKIAFSSTFNTRMDYGVYTAEAYGHADGRLSRCRVRLLCDLYLVLFARKLTISPMSRSMYTSCSSRRYSTGIRWGK